MLPISKDDKTAVFFQYFGLVVLLYTLAKNGYKAFNNLTTFFLKAGAVNFKKYGSWAVVTGCTDGIGKAYAEALAKKGLNIVLISRSQDKLNEMAKDLTEKFSVQTKVIAADFTEPDSIYIDIKKKIADLDIAILVNNVGMGYKHPEYFHTFAECDAKNINNMLYCNVTSLTKMSAIVLPGMVERKGGVIINNASASGRIPTPLLTVYSATKAYVDFFSRGLNVEYKSKGIIVQSLCPYFVSTKLSAMRSSWMAPMPKQYVASALNTISTQSVTNGCLIHNIQGWLLENVIPTRLLDTLTFSQMASTRVRALAKIKKTTVS